MTMLDRMRRHKNWLKWSLALVVVAFVLLYIPDFMAQPGTGAATGDTIAQVAGHKITAGEFRRIYDAQLESYRNAYGDSISESLLKQLGIDQQILQQLIDEQAALVEARRLGLSASDAEVRQRIVSLPGLQENGQFIGRDRYEQLLRMQRPPVHVTEFEESIRRSIVLEKLRAALTDWIVVADDEVDREFRRRNEKVRLEAVALDAADFREQLSVTDEQVQAHFEAHRERYRMPERRRIRYAAIDLQEIHGRTVVSEAQLRAAYDADLDQHTTPEEVRASHILLPTEGRDEDAVRQEAEELLARVRGGADFADLARKHSGDELSAERGGDLDFFGRGRMVPEFEQAAFALEPGQISDLVRTQYGYHIIKVADRREETVRSFDEVRPQLEEELKWERAQAEATRLADGMAAEIRRPADLDRVAPARGLTVQESEFFGRDEPVPGPGLSPAITTRAFELKEGDVDGPIRSGQGYVFYAVTAVQPPYVPALDEVRERVREDLMAEQALAAARERAERLLPDLGRNFAEGARAAGLEVRSTELITRGTPIPEVGTSPALDRAAFELPAGSVSDPIAVDAAIVVVHVVEREDVTPEQVAAGREELREQMLNEQRSRFFSSYMAKAKGRMSIEVNTQVLRQVI
jgi:peptidyl-prolyl cis-trans isomerase D